jgi:hypothetical protein
MYILRVAVILSMAAVMGAQFYFTLPIHSSSTATGTLENTVNEPMTSGWMSYTPQSPVTSADYHPSRPYGPAPQQLPPSSQLPEEYLHHHHQHSLQQLTGGMSQPDAWYVDSRRSLIPNSMIPPPPMSTRAPPAAEPAYTFAAGSWQGPCFYGLPVPQYTTPTKKCVPYHPMCGFLFTCVMDV